MGKSIRKLAVVGAGTMGAAIAACGARAGLDVILMVRGKAEQSGRDRAHDLVIEAVAENLAVKQSTAKFIFDNASDGTIVGTNTSNISIASIAEGMAEERKRRFLGIHFFNPVRYMDLVELIPNAETDDEIVRSVRALINDRFGKTPILCKDAPGFIANRIGSMALTSIMNATTDCGYGFAKEDALTGDLIFRPKQGAFKLLDLVGLDISVHTVDYMAGADITRPAWASIPKRKAPRGRSVSSGITKRPSMPRSRARRSTRSPTCAIRKSVCAACCSETIPKRPSCGASCSSRCGWL